jgi:hypothetical protein
MSIAQPLLLVIQTHLSWVISPEGAAMTDAPDLTGSSSQDWLPILIDWARTQTCPRCGGTTNTPLLWGEPLQAATEASCRGEVVLGGCLPPEDPWPDLVCQRCGNWWVGETEGGQDQWAVARLS